MDVKDAIGIQIALKKTYEKTSKEISIACEMAAVALKKRDKLNPVSNKNTISATIAGRNLIGKKIAKTDCNPSLKSL